MPPLLLGLLLGCSPQPLILAETPPPAAHAVSVPLTRFLWPGPALPEAIEKGHTICRAAAGEAVDPGALRRALEKGWLQLGVVELAGVEVRLGGARVEDLGPPERSRASNLILSGLEARMTEALAGANRINEACGTTFEPQLAVIAGEGANVQDVVSLIYTAGKAGLLNLWLVVADPDATPWAPPAAWQGAPQPAVTLASDAAGVRVLSQTGEPPPRGPVALAELATLLDPAGTSCAIAAVTGTSAWGAAIQLLDTAQGAGIHEVLLALSVGADGLAQDPDRSRPAPTPGGQLDWERPVAALPLNLPSTSGETVISPSGACLWSAPPVEEVLEEEVRSLPASGERSALLKALESQP